MNRRAILLAASPDRNPIPSVYPDLAAFYSFLQSNLGGAWRSDEMFRSQNPTRNQILSAINTAKGVDYTLVFFAGHGETVKMGLPWLETRILLSSGETVTERELNSGSARCTLILDCSRRTAEEYKGGLLPNISKLLEHGEQSSDFRDLYERSIANAESGLVKVNAAASNTVADKDSFTQHLLNESYTWAARNKGTLNLREAVKNAKSAIKQEILQQPEYQGGRRLRHFPFAVQI